MCATRKETCFYFFDKLFFFPWRTILLRLKRFSTFHVFREYRRWRRIRLTLCAGHLRTITVHIDDGIRSRVTCHEGITSSDAYRRHRCHIVFSLVRSFEIWRQRGWNIWIYVSIDLLSVRNVRFLRVFRSESLPRSLCRRTRGCIRK